MAAVAAVGMSIAIPGLGLVIAGPLAGAIAGAGGAAGGLVGALVGWGIPEERVKRYESGIKNGEILMGGLGDWALDFGISMRWSNSW